MTAETSLETRSGTRSETQSEAPSSAPDREPTENGAPPGFVVVQPGYSGDLAGLARALRSGALTPRELDLLALVRDALAWFDAEADRDLDGASVALPQVAQVIELKLRLMLPKPPRDPADEEAAEDAEDALRAVALLEELEGAIDFLRRRRFERGVVIPVRTPRPELPRPSRPLAATADRLASLASNLRPGGYFEMAVERLTLDGAMRTLRRALASLGRGSLATLHPAGDWAERTVVFAGMLELVREGRAQAVQEAPYGEIVLSSTRRGRTGGTRGSGARRDDEGSGPS